MSNVPDAPNPRLSPIAGRRVTVRQLRGLLWGTPDEGGKTIDNTKTNVRKLLLALAKPPGAVNYDEFQKTERGLEGEHTYDVLCAATNSYFQDTIESRLKSWGITSVVPRVVRGPINKTSKSVRLCLFWQPESRRKALTFEDVEQEEFYWNDDGTQEVSNWSTSSVEASLRGDVSQNDSPTAMKTTKPSESTRVTSPASFREWLAGNRDILPKPHMAAASEPHTFVVGDVIIVDAAAEKSGYPRIVLQQVDFPLTKFHELMKKFEPEWSEQRARYASKDGIKASVVWMNFPLTDDADLDIKYGLVPFNLVRPCQEVIQGGQKRELVSREAFKFNRPEGRLLPSSITMDVALVLEGDGKSGSHLLLSHRTFRDTGYFSDTWSSSYEETFAAVESDRDGKRCHADLDLNATVKRGLQEELLGDDFNGPLDIASYGLFVNLFNTSIEFITVARVHMGFDEVVARWTSGKTRDAKEHNALATLPLKRDVLRLALAGGGPRGLVDNSFPQPKESDIRLGHAWHPGSPARLACCLWLVEAGLL